MASPLAALVAKVDEERAANASDGASSEGLSDRHKALVRAAGRASIEDTLLNPTRAELTVESLAAEWLAYAEVFGTNGMASGGARHGEEARGTAPDEQPVEVQAVCSTSRRRIGATVLAVVVVAVATIVARQRHAQS